MIKPPSPPSPALKVLLGKTDKIWWDTKLHQWQRTGFSVPAFIRRCQPISYEGWVSRIKAHISPTKFEGIAADLYAACKDAGIALTFTEALEVTYHRRINQPFEGWVRESNFREWLRAKHPHFIIEESTEEEDSKGVDLWIKMPQSLLEAEKRIPIQIKALSFKPELHQHIKYPQGTILVLCGLDGEPADKNLFTF